MRSTFAESSQRRRSTMSDTEPPLSQTTTNAPKRGLKLILTVALIACPVLASTLLYSTHVNTGGNLWFLDRVYWGGASVYDGPMNR
jgi:hypothetical protein